jgi:hypothetical protein
MATRSTPRRKRKREQPSRTGGEDEENGQSSWMFLPVAWTAIPSNKRQRRTPQNEEDGSVLSGFKWTSSSSSKQPEATPPSKFLTISWQWFNKKSHWTKIECCISDAQVTVEEWLHDYFQTAMSPPGLLST